jgi:iron complex outermembrane recepter protein
MFKRNNVCAAALTALGSVLLLPAAPSYAQSGERVEITGSRIRTVGNVSSSPISSVGLADINTTQPVAVEELVRGLPSAYPALGPGINNGSTGIASVDLRGLGSNRTLVLINGKRFVPANLGGVVDTNNVPVSLLERVDLVTGGASAVYGADAVSGVVNFVTRRNFTGIEARTMYSVSGEGDAKRRNNDLTLGANLADGRGNVAVHVGTTRTEALRLGERDYANTVISSTNGRPGGFSDTAVPAQYVFGGLPTGSALAGNQVVDATTGRLRAASGALPPDGYNTNPPNYFETPLTRTQITGLGRFTINEYAEAYSEVFAIRSNVTLNLAPSGTFGASLNVPIGNPYIPADVRTQICAAYSFTAAECVAGAGGTRTFTASIRRRFVEAGPRIQIFDNSVMQYTFGVRGAIPLLDGWGYDAYYQKGRSEQKFTTQNAFSLSKLRNAINATSTTTCTGTAGCVPINVFGGAGTITAAMLDYLRIPTFQTTEVRQEVLSASANGDIAIAKSPFARNPLSMAVGLEQREVFGGNRSDNVVQTQGEVLGSGAPTPDRQGLIKFNEYYLEASLPLVQGLPFVESFSIGGGYRNTELKTDVGGTQTYGSWKTGLDFSPIKGLRFRAEAQRATRAPNVNELYAPVTTGLGTLAVDPCQATLIGPVLPSDTAAVAANKPALTALCQATGITAGQVGTVPAPASSQINVTSGGNPSLSPERADTTTFGLVWEPTFVPNLSLTLDYWNIKIRGAVATPNAAQVINGCYNPSQNPGLSFNAFCAAIERSPLSGGLNGTGFRGVSVQSANLGKVDFDGIDVGASYRLPMSAFGLSDMGRIDFTFTGTYQFNADFQSLPTLPVVEGAGFYGIDVGTPYSRIRFTQRSTWTNGPFSLGYSWRFVGGTEVQRSAQIAGTYLDDYEKIKGVHYVDLNGSWQVLKNLRLSLTINNAFDKQPPFTGTGVAGGAVNYGNTFPTVYDVIGRRYTFTAIATF